MSKVDIIEAIILVIILLSLLVALTGCNLIEVNMVQRSITDVGDGTVDSYTSDDDKTNEDTMKVIVPIK